MNATQVSLLHKLINQNYDTVVASSDNNLKAGLGLAVWEVVYDGANGTSGLNLTSGTLKVNSSSQGTTAVTDAQQFLNALSSVGTTTDKYDLLAWTSPQSQDQITVVPHTGTGTGIQAVAPEPSSLALLTAGALGAAGLLRRRKRPARS
jgi:hypothetical protein